MSNQDTVTLRYGTASATVRVAPGLSVDGAFRQAAGALGINGSDNLSYRCGSQSVPGTDLAAAGATYSATAVRDGKGA